MFLMNHKVSEQKVNNKFRADLNAGDRGSQFMLQKFQHNLTEEGNSFAGDLVSILHLETMDVVTVSEKKIYPAIQLKYVVLLIDLVGRVGSTTQMVRSRARPIRRIFRCARWTSTRSNRGTILKCLWIVCRHRRRILESSRFNLSSCVTYRRTSVHKQTINIDSHNLFEIQPLNPFNDKRSNHQHSYRIKHLFTSLYLCVDKTDPKKVHLTTNALDDDCIFDFLGESKHSDTEQANELNGVFSV